MGHWQVEVQGMLCYLGFPKLFRIIFPAILKLAATD